MAKKKKNKIPLPIFILICAVLLYATYTSLTTLTLAVWGDSVLGTVDSYDSRLDDSQAGPNRSRTVSKGYYFTVGGKEYRGYVIYSSDEAWPRLDQGETRTEYISYLSSFPYINKPSALASFSEMGEVAIIYHLLSPLGCLLLLRLVTGTLKNKKKGKKAARKVNGAQNKGIRGDANMFCHNCGAQLKEGAAFCPHCGAQAGPDKANSCPACGTEIPQDAAFCANCGTAVNSGGTLPPPAGSYGPPAAGQTGNLVGFSAYYNCPEILEAAEKNRKSTNLFLVILILAPPIGFTLAGLLIDDYPLGEGLVIGVGIALLILLINTFGLIRAKQPMWEGTVVNQYSKERSEHRGGEEDNYRTYTEYTTVIKTDGGKKRTIVEKDSGRHMYDYLAVGDRVRYHPKFGTYEKYDKSKDRIIYCNVCTTMNPIANDRCKRCNNLLFK